MELGISPLFTSSMFLNMITQTGIITYDKTIPLDAHLFEQLEKLLGIIVSLCTAIIYVTTGMYGSLSEVGLTNAILIILQLTIASIIVIYLDEMLTLGYGIGSG